MAAHSDIEVIIPVIIFILIMVLFSRLSKHPTKLNLFLVAVGLWCVSYFVDASASTMMLGVVGVFRLTGLIGISLGIYGFFKKEPRSVPAAAIAPTEIQYPAMARNLKCPQCGLINDRSIPYCRRCSTQLFN